MRPLNPDRAGRPDAPVVFLDLDGVLNPFAAPTCPDGYQERVLFDGEDPQRYCLAHADWIRELAAAGELWWATGWGEAANEVYLPLLGVAPLPVVGFPPVPFDPELKVPAVDAVAADRPAAWLDDNHTAVGRRWAAARSVPTLLVSIDPATGWTRADVERVLTWAASLTR
ncbi:hypothetical protein [Verrucosispora sp. WMMC514]|uniref:hypothetical protein n=1 Tax=Verrucosispora sp. WMMC514 TaxID=3015156 RepID=UPI00248C49A5|nr:hypothetical protein [Verrucosispora sp. WMMC514]WBB91048.1 hypothetical protein O7597_29515 [Verrucosispora sp. WMMC514]